MTSELTQITASLHHMKKSHAETINKLNSIRVISVKIRANELSKINLISNRYKYPLNEINKDKSIDRFKMI